MSNPDSATRQSSPDRSSPAADASLAMLHIGYRGQTHLLENAIATAKGEQLARLRTVLSNLRAEQK